MVGQTFLSAGGMVGQTFLSARTEFAAANGDRQECLSHQEDPRGKRALAPARDADVTCKPR